MTISRRKFIGTTAAATLGLTLGASELFAKSKFPPIGIQTYTVPFLLGGYTGTDKSLDVKAGLKKLADIGIKELETVGGLNGLFHGYKSKEFSMMAKDAGMKWVSHHSLGIMGKDMMARMSGGADASAVRMLSTNLQAVVDDCAEGGAAYVICASSAVTTLDEIKQTTELFNKAGEACKKAGLQFGYHNHQSEFTAVEGVTAYEYIMKNTDKEKVIMELDLAWTTAAGKDPVAMFKEHPGRFPLWHVKDLDKETKRPCPVGKGIVDFKHAFDNSKLSGLKHFFIEQDGAKVIEDPASSVAYLNSNIL